MSCHLNSNFYYITPLQESNEECRQIFLKFPEPTDEDKVKELDSNIESVFILKDKRRLFYWFHLKIANIFYTDNILLTAAL